MDNNYNLKNIRGDFKISVEYSEQVGIIDKNSNKI